MHDEKKILPFAALFVGIISISWSAIFVRWTDMSGVASAFYRVLIASIALWIILLAQRGSRLRISSRSVPLSALGGIFFAADVGLYNVAVLHTSAGSATFLGNNAPIVVGLVTWFLTRKLPSFRFWVALAIAILGTCLIVSIDWNHMRSSFSADLLASIASICFAFYLLTTERLRTNTDTVTIVVLSTTASAAALLVFSFAAHISLAIPGFQSLLAVAGLGFICQLTGYFCLTYALGHVPATVSSIVLLAVAPITALLAFFLFGEQMTRLQILGGGFILAAVWIIANQPQPSSLET
ncbi:DMT family transporter [Tunturibacter empetritectus]|uniref:DMT family transporter n=1 Tax=Tunturiibacter empetritectus TaxID=3069691 RepID=A0AAU7ZHY2_9BACT